MASDKMDRGLDEIIADKVGASCPSRIRQPCLYREAAKTTANQSTSAAMGPETDAVVVTAAVIVKITPVTG
jgi:hypothetical protein